MAEWLVVRMPRGNDSVAAWLIADAAGRPLGAVQSGALEAAGAAAAGRRVAVLVPAADVLSLNVELPARAGARAAQLVPFALEEQLATDIEGQHFAIGRSGPGGSIAVAVVARTLMEEWRARLAAARLRPELLCSDDALLPRMAGHRVALLEGNTLCLAAADAGPALTMSAPPGSFAGAIAAACGEAAADTRLVFHCSPPDWQRRSAEIEAARPLLASLQIQLLGSGALPWLAAQLPEAAAINLLQGPYAPRTNFSERWLRWRVAAALVAALVLLHLASQGLLYWRLQRTDRELDRAIAALAGPQLAAGSGSIRSRLEPSLLGAQGQGGRSGLLPALQGLAQAMNGVSGARVQALSFRDGALQLKLRAGDAHSLDRINQNLRAAGWQAELISGGAAGDAFEGSIQLRGGAS
jgi:general secretion pathway protein L